MGCLKYNFQNLAIFEMVPKKFINGTQKIGLTHLNTFHTIFTSKFTKLTIFKGGCPTTCYSNEVRFSNDII